MDTLAYQIDKIKKLYAYIEDYVTDHVMTRDEGNNHILPEIEKDIIETLKESDVIDKALREHITLILRGTVTNESTQASAIASGVDDDVKTQPLPPSSPRANVQAGTLPAKNLRLPPQKK